MKPLFFIFFILFGFHENRETNVYDFSYEHNFSEDLCSESFDHFKLNLNNYLISGIKLNQFKIFNSNIKSVIPYVDSVDGLILFEYNNIRNVMTFPDNKGEKLKVFFRSIKLSRTSIKFEAVIEGCYNPSSKWLYRKESEPNWNCDFEKYKANYSESKSNLVQNLNQYLYCLEKDVRSRFCLK